MTPEEFYNNIQSSYEEISARLMTDERIVRFLNKFLAIDDFSLLQQAYQDNNPRDIFMYVHRLKGIALNLSLSNLGKYTSELTELYRNDDAPDAVKAKEVFENVKSEYSKIAELIPHVKDSSKS